MEHVPVLLSEVLEHFPTTVSSEPVMLDATFGRGGHSRALMNKFPQLRVIGLDWDLDAQVFAEENFKSETEEGRFSFFRSSYANIDEVMRHLDPTPEFDFILADLGVSSPQLDRAERGFSFYNEGPLDMRMDQTKKVTAGTLVNELSSEELMDIFSSYGEVHNPFRVVRALVADREKRPFTTTLELSSLIERVDGWRKKGAHPATRYFQALRIEVNRELSDLEEALPQFLNALKCNGRLAIISFHSLEDRLIKQTFKAWETEWGRRIQRKVIKPSEEEIKSNPRSRSAKLRVFEKQKEGTL